MKLNKKRFSEATSEFRKIIADHSIEAQWKRLGEYFQEYKRGRISEEEYTAVYVASIRLHAHLPRPLSRLSDKSNYAKHVIHQEMCGEDRGK